MEFSSPAKGTSHHFKGYKKVEIAEKGEVVTTVLLAWVVNQIISELIHFFSWLVKIKRGLMSK